MTSKIIQIAFTFLFFEICRGEAIMSFSVKIVDEGNNPLKKFEVVSKNFDHWEPGEGFGRDVYKYQESLTNDEGVAIFKTSSVRGDLYIYPKITDGYYKTSKYERNYQISEIKNGEWHPKNQQFELQLKKIRNPVPLYAKNLNEGLLVPVLGNKCGYDFEIGDWVAPKGRGVTEDICFLVKVSQEPNGDFESSIEVTFPHEKDGLIFFEQNRDKGSKFVSDYLAPLEGYKPNKTLNRSKKDGKITSDIDIQSGNYYLRLRTRLDDKGNIGSANYAKIYGDFMYFTYYFNPTPNDRNLEFDPKRNLFTNLKSKERVEEP